MPAGLTSPFLFIPLALCHFLTASAVAAVNSASTVTPRPKPRARRFRSSCSTSGPFTPFLSVRYAGSLPYMRMRGLRSIR